MTVSVQVQIHVLYCISRYLCPFARRQRRSSSRDIGMLKITDFVVNCVRYQCRYCSCNAEKFSWYCETLTPTPSPPRTVVVVVISVLYTYCSCNAVNLVVMPKMRSLLRCLLYQYTYDFILRYSWPSARRLEIISTTIRFQTYCIFVFVVYCINTVHIPYCTVACVILVPPRDANADSLLLLLLVL